MRNIVLGFLTILMLMPSLACAMPSCVGEKNVAAANQPCAGHHSEHEKGKKETGKVNLLIDCMGVDMQTADTASMDKPDLKTDFVIYVMVADVLTSNLVNTDAATIRGPPPDWPSIGETQPSLILTTQRFRI